MNSWIPDEALQRVDPACVARYWDDALTTEQNCAQIGYWLRQRNGLSAADSKPATPPGIDS